MSRKLLLVAWAMAAILLSGDIARAREYIPADLVAWYPLGDGAGTVAHDSQHRQT